MTTVKGEVGVAGTCRYSGHPTTTLVEWQVPPCTAPGTVNATADRGGNRSGNSRRASRRSGSAAIVTAPRTGLACGIPRAVPGIAVEPRLPRSRPTPKLPIETRGVEPQAAKIDGCLAGATPCP